jgi:hypothetical protein
MFYGIMGELAAEVIDKTAIERVEYIKSVLITFFEPFIAAEDIVDENPIIQK